MKYNLTSYVTEIFIYVCVFKYLQTYVYVVKGEKEEEIKTTTTTTVSRL